MKSADVAYLSKYYRTELRSDTAYRGYLAVESVEYFFYLFIKLVELIVYVFDVVDICFDQC